MISISIGVCEQQLYHKKYKTELGEHQKEIAKS